MQLISGSPFLTKLRKKEDDKEEMEAQKKNREGKGTDKCS